MRVRQTLGLHVSWSVEILFDKALTSTKCSDRLTSSRFKEFFDLTLFANDFDASSTSTEGGFDGNRDAVLGYEVFDFLN